MILLSVGVCVFVCWYVVVLVVSVNVRCLC